LIRAGQEAVRGAFLMHQIRSGRETGEEEHAVLDAAVA
jgi:hypothetical protein